jgi:hypothetical protein
MATKQQKYITWGELKEFCNKLPDSQLKKHIHWWGEEKGGSVSRVYQLPEDFVTTDYGLEPLSVQEPPEEGEDQYSVTHPKGTPILEVD